MGRAVTYVHVLLEWHVETAVQEARALGIGRIWHGNICGQDNGLVSALLPMWSIWDTLRPQCVA